MPWGWECRAKLIKQNPHKPTERRGGEADIITPGPDHYESKQLIGGNGYSQIKRSPAYTFGHLTKVTFIKPAALPNAPQFNIRGMTKKGRYKIRNGVVTPHIEPVEDKTKKPGPLAYAPPHQLRYKRPPAYTMRIAAKPPFQPYDQWTAPPNMYHPPIPGKNAPAYSLGYGDRPLKLAYVPGPGEHDPNFNYVKKTKPAFSFGAPFRKPLPPKSPNPNSYCEKKFNVIFPTGPAPSFGIHHSPYIGHHQAYLRNTKKELSLINE